jgi:hypothetical protein
MDTYYTLGKLIVGFALTGQLVLCNLRLGTQALSQSLLHVASHGRSRWPCLYGSERTSVFQFSGPFSALTY